MTRIADALERIAAALEDRRARQTVARVQPAQKMAGTPARSWSSGSAQDRCRGRVLAVLSEGPKKAGALRARLSAAQQEHMYAVLDALVTEGAVVKGPEGYSLPG